MEQTECSETSAYKIQTLGNYPEETYNIQNAAKVWNKHLLWNIYVENAGCFSVTLASEFMLPKRR
jgi:hypothetical protein